MNKAIWILIAGIFLVTTNAIQAATQPKFVLTPLTHTTFPIALDEVVNVRYRVTNSTKITRTLTMVPIQGISQTTSGNGACANPFTLAHNQSCVLTLSLLGSALPATVTTGPEICAKEEGSNTPDPFLCSQPSKNDSLNVTVIPTKRARLLVQPSILTLVANGLARSITVTNSSALLTARNIRADLTGTALDGNVTQNASNCVSVAPGATCTLTFTPSSRTISLTRFPIQGDNTLKAGAAIQVASLAFAPISVAGSPLILGSQQIGSLTITNHSLSRTASNIAAVLTADLVAAGVTQNASDCVGPIAAGGTCTLSFTAGTTGIDSNNTVDIYGTDTSLTTATISVNTTSLQTISFDGSSSLTLPANGSSTGTMTIVNGSGAVIAAGLTAHFASTELNGIVTATTCEEIPVGGRCTITFTAGTTTIAATPFPIYGPNTITLEGTISITPTPQAYLSSSNSDDIYRCLIDETAYAPILTQCQTQRDLGLNFPKGIVINPTQTRAYIANNGNSVVTQCDIDPSNNNLTDCQSALANGVGSLYGIALNPAGTKAYIVNASQDSISYCPVNASTGSFDNDCITSNTTGLNTPRDIVIDPGNTYAYIANLDGENIVRCSVQSNGDLSSCAIVYTRSGIKFNGITMNHAGTLIYMSVWNVSTQIVCPISFIGCVDTSIESSPLNSAGIVVNAADTVNYIANAGNSLEYTFLELNDSGYVSSFGSDSTLPNNVWGIALLE